MSEPSPPSPAGPARVVAFLPDDTPQPAGVVADLAWRLAAAGRRVLVIDWDRTATSVSGHLSPFQLTPPAEGDDPSAGPSRFAVEMATIAENVTAPAESGAESGAGGGAGEDDGVVRFTATRYAVPVETGRLDVVAPGPEFDGAPPRLAPHTPVETLGVRAMARNAGYQDVLVCGLSGPPEDLALQAANLCDAVVVRVRPERCDAGEVSETLTALRRRMPTENVVTLAVREGGAVAAGGCDVEILAGAHPDTATPHGAELATLISADRDDDPRLAEAMGALADLVTGGEIDRLPPVPPLVRTLYRHRVGHGDDEPAVVVGLAWAPEDRPWADWVWGQLEQVGAVVTRLDPAAGEAPAVDALLVVDSTSFTRYSQRTGLRDRLARLGAVPAGSTPSAPRAPTDTAGGAGPVPTVVLGLTAGHQTPDLLPTRSEWARIDLGDHSATVFWDLVRLRLGLVSAPLRAEWFSSAAPPAYPRAGALAGLVADAPGRNPGFVGRAGEIEAIRDRFLTSDRGRTVPGPFGPVSRQLEPVVVVGQAGIGKSQLALEYAHRFRHDYQVIWWIPADDPYQVRQRLVELAECLDIRTGGDPVREVIRHLEHSTTRWLLIYDNADEPESLEELRPRHGIGHLLMTARPPAAADARPPLSLGPLTRTEGAELLRQLVPKLSDEHAAQVATATGGHPLSLRIASAWLRERTALTGPGLGRERRPRLPGAVTELCRDLGDRVNGDGPRTMVRLALQLVRRNEPPRLGWATTKLVEICAFLSADGIALRLLRSQPFLDQLAAATESVPGAAATPTDADGSRTDETDGAEGGVDEDWGGAGPAAAALRRDAVQIDRLIWTCARYGLVDVDWGRTQTVLIHRVVQGAVRQVMSGAAVTQRTRQVRLALARFAPTEAELEDPGARMTLDELQQHFRVSGAVDSTEVEVAQWVVKQIRYLTGTGDARIQRLALEEAERAEAVWKDFLATAGHDHATWRRQRDLGEVRGWLQIERANLYRDLGEVNQALELSTDLLRRRRAVVSQWLHPRTLRAAQTRALALREIGDFEDALDEELRTVSALERVYGPDHRRTLIATSNVVWSRFLMGETASALRHAEALSRRYAEAMPGDRLVRCLIQRDIATFHRELGAYGRAVEIFVQTEKELRSLRSPDHPQLLMVRRGLAVATRLAGDPERARHIDSEALKTYRATVGDNHPDTRACRLSLAADHAALGDVQDAVEEAEECVDDYQRALRKNHPFILLAMANLAVFCRMAGRRAAATRHGKASWDELGNRLEPTHPWALAAGVNYANILAENGDLAQARRITESVHDGLHEYHGNDHPYTRIARRNVAVLVDSVDRPAATPPAGLHDVVVDVPQA